jgi:hypothetical protein
MAASSGSSPEPSSVPEGAPNVSVSVGGGGGGTSRRCRTVGTARPMTASMSVPVSHLARTYFPTLNFNLPT